MWRSAWCAVLLPSLVFSQEIGAANPNLPTVQGQPQHQQLRMRYFTYYSEVRRGRREKAAIELSLIVDNGQYLPAVLPLNLELEQTDGFTVSKVKYPRTYEYITAPYGGYKIRHANGGSVKFRLRVDRKVNLGVHTLKGRLRFQIVTEKGALAPQEIEVVIPLRVVEHNAKVTKCWPYRWVPSKKELILLLPVLIIFFVFESIGCVTGFGCSS